MIDRVLMKRVLVDLQVAVDDADSTAADMLRPPRQRELRQVLLRVQYREARRKIVEQIAYLMRMAEEGAAGPAGEGGPPH
ncbi:MAG: hypothetical protein QM820_38935 [Minicystis sp.]